MDSEQAAKVAQFCGITGQSESTARHYLEENGSDLNAAVAHFFAQDDEASNDDEEDDSEHLVQERQLGSSSNISRSVASSALQPTAKSTKASQPRKKIQSLSDLQNAAHSNDDDDDEKDQEYFAGGDKSGLAVQEPGSGHNQHIQRLLDTARRNGPPPPAEDDRPRSNFSGQGQTLGGDDAPSEIIPDPTANTRRAPPMVERILHLWDDGFSIDDGQLYRYDDPANRRTLEMINRGSAPLDLMNVEPGQAVDVKLDAHRGETYKQPKKKWTPFASGGQRLGSPVPGIASSSSSASPSAPSFTSVPSTAVPTAPSIEVDESQPIITLQIRLADGTRLPSRFNTTHTIENVYAFVNRASQASTQRPYSLATTFPTKELTNKEQVLGEMPEFKRGGVIVQKWS